MALSADEEREIRDEAANYPTRSALCIDAMKIVQRHRGWVSDDALRDIAGYLDMSVDELDGIATFYNMIFRRPVGSHVILLCDSVSCWIMGYERLREHLAQTLGADLGETSADGRFTVLPNVCLGDCDHAPVMMIDNEHYRDLDPARIDDILDRYRKEQWKSDDGNTPDAQHPARR
jgi:NADH-quinone oxidoreductase subunit E